MRLAVARDEGLDEATITAAEQGAAITDAQRDARALADQLMTQPGAIDDGLIRALRTSFSDDQLLELTLDVMKWNYQKVSVALGLDAEVRPGQLTDLVFDEHGHWVRPA